MEFLQLDSSAFCQPQKSQTPPLESQENLEFSVILFYFSCILYFPGVPQHPTLV